MDPFQIKESRGFRKLSGRFFMSAASLFRFKRGRFIFCVFALPIGQGELYIYMRLQNKIDTRRDIDNHNNSNNINS